MIKTDAQDGADTTTPHTQKIFYSGWTKEYKRKHNGTDTEKKMYLLEMMITGVSKEDYERSEEEKLLLYEFTDDKKNLEGCASRLYFKYKEEKRFTDAYNIITLYKFMPEEHVAKETFDAALNMITERLRDGKYKDAYNFIGKTMDLGAKAGKSRIEDKKEVIGKYLTFRDIIDNFAKKGFEKEEDKKYLMMLRNDIDRYAETFKNIYGM